MHLEDAYALSISRSRFRTQSDVGVEAAYNIHPGFALGEIFAFWQGFEYWEDGGLVQPVAKESTLQGAVAAAARTLYCPAQGYADSLHLGFSL